MKWHVIKKRGWCNYEIISPCHSLLLTLWKTIFQTCIALSLTSLKCFWDGVHWPVHLRLLVTCSHLVCSWQFTICQMTCQQCINMWTFLLWSQAIGPPCLVSNQGSDGDVSICKSSLQISHTRHRVGTEWPQEHWGGECAHTSAPLPAFKLLCVQVETQTCLLSVRHLNIFAWLLIVCHQQNTMQICIWQKETGKS